jgi:hypothetical protein
MSPSRRRTFLTGLGLAATSALAGCAGFAGPTVVENSTQSYSRGDYDAVAVGNRNGDVRVEPAASDTEEVTVEIRKRGRSQDALDRVAVESTVEDGLITVESVYENQFSGVSVRLVVSVPEGLTVQSARTGNGDVVVDGVVGDVTAATGTGDAEAVDVDGYVTVESANGDAVARGTTGIAGGSSGNGDVEVEVFALREDVSLSTGNGEVAAGVAADLDADVVLSVGNGDIEEDVDLTDRSGDRNRVTGRLGDGGPELTLSSGNGDVRLYPLDG